MICLDPNRVKKYEKLTLETSSWDTFIWTCVKLVLSSTSVMFSFDFGRSSLEAATKQPVESLDIGSNGPFRPGKSCHRPVTCLLFRES